jgi:hypothetical protein
MTLSQVSIIEDPDNIFKNGIYIVDECRIEIMRLSIFSFATMTSVAVMIAGPRPEVMIKALDSYIQKRPARYAEQTEKDFQAFWKILRGLFRLVVLTDEEDLAMMLNAVKSKRDVEIFGVPGGVTTLQHLDKDQMDSEEE